MKTEPVPARAADRQRRYWQRNRRLTAWLLAVWFVVTFGIAFFARELDFGFLGSPFGFWVAAQGAPLVFLAIVWIYALAMERIDAERGDPDDD